MTHGVDNMQAGARTFWTGVPTDTMTSQALQGLGVSRPTANTINSAITLVGGVAPTYLQGNLPQTMTHYTTTAGKEGIMQSGMINGGPGIADRGVYMTTTQPFPVNPFVPPNSTVPVTFPTPDGTMRIIPGLIYIKYGNGVPLQ